MNHHNQKQKLTSQTFFQQLLLLAILLALSAFLSIYSDFFFSGKNLLNILNNHMAHQLILAVGMTFVISTGGIDLSVGSILASSGIVTGILLKAGLPIPLCIAIGIAAAVLMGAINGLVVANFNINPLIITLGTAAVYGGLGLIVTGGTPIYQMPQEFVRIVKHEMIGLPLPIVISILVLAASIVLLTCTRWGQYTLTLGSNELALTRLGVNVKLHKVSVYALNGLMAGIASIIITARMNVAEATAGAGMEMNAIAAVIMGGTLLSGGKGTLLGTTIACLLLSVMKNGLTMMSVNAHYQEFIIGAILLFAVLATDMRQKKLRLKR